MSEEKPIPDLQADLRQRAEEVLEPQPGVLRKTQPDDVQHMIHELQVHQIELELQNEELRRTQLDLELARDRYLDLYNFAPVGYLTLSERGLILQANLTAATMLGMDRAHLNMQPLSSFIPNEDQDIYYLHRRELFETQELQDWEMRMVRKDGSQFWARIDAAVSLDSEGQAVCRATMSDITGRVRAESERDATLETLQQSKQRLEQTLAELKATQEQIVQQERLAAVGQLAAGVAHDFNNLLTSMIGFAELVRMDAEVPEKVQPDLDRIVKHGQRAANLVQQILDFSRKSLRQPQPLKLAPSLKEAVKFLGRTIPETIHIRLEIEAVEPMIHADPTQLQQVVTNLAVNARDAMPKGGELKLHLSALTLEPGDESPCPDMSPGDWVLLSVSDTGTGIAAEILPRIFDPFFTTRAPEGSGLGLAQVYGIVKQQGGNIKVESQVGEGTTFSIYLPALAKTEETPRGKAREEISRGQGQTVLLVEDEPTVLEVAQAMLERLGYRVLTAADGQQALAVYREHQDQIGLVLADVVMPKMGGVALLHVLKRQNPDVKVVLTTGYPLGEEAQKVLAQGIVDWLEKPMSVTRLAQVVSRAFQG